MKWLVFSIVLIGTGIWFATHVFHANESIQLIIANTQINTHAWVAILASFIVLLLGYASIRLILGLIHAPTRFLEWQARRRRHKARLLTQRGLCLLAEGQWSYAEESLIEAAELKNNPLINYLAAANAAQAQHAYDRRDQYFQHAHEKIPSASLAISCAQAKAQVDAKQWEQALVTLETLYKKNETSSLLLRLLATVYKQLGEWRSLEKLLKPIKKYQALSLDEQSHLSEDTYFHLLKEAADRHVPHLSTIWRQLPDQYQQSEQFQCLYADALLKQNQDEQAIDFIEHCLKKQWHTGLLLRYAQAQHPDDPAHLLRTMQHYAKKHERDPIVLLGLSRLYARTNDLAAAKSALQQSIALRPSPIALTELGDLCVLQNQTQEAETYFRQALAMLLA
jgi:HemY protein